jgi:hypothetical protein
MTLLYRLSWLGSVAMWAFGSLATCQPGLKRLILHDYGGSHRLEPGFVANHLEYLETLPFDGLAILVSRSHGRDNISGLVMQPSPISLSRISSVLAPVSDIKSNRLTTNFALVYFGPGYDVYDDAKWEMAAQNMANFANAIQEAGLVGIFFDNENYEDYGDWRPGSPTCDARLHTLYDCQTKMRQRGGQIMRALQSQFPEIKVMFFHDAYTSDRTFFDENLDLPNVDHANELVGPFLVGFVEAKGSKAAVIQGGENAAATTFGDFDRLYQYSKHAIVSGKGSVADASSRAVRPDGRGYIPLSLQSRWPSLVGCATQVRNLDKVDTNGAPRNLTVAVANALRRADEFAWLYMDVPAKTAIHTSLLEPPGRSVHSATQEFVDAVRAGREAAFSRRTVSGRKPH